MVDWSAPASEASNKRLLYEITMGILIVVSSAVHLVVGQTVSWAWFGLGIFAIVLACVVSRTSPGRWVDKWFNQIGNSGRFAVVFVFALVTWGTMWSFKPPVIPIASFVVGSTSVLTAVPALRLLKRIGENERQHPV